MDWKVDNHLLGDASGRERFVLSIGVVSIVIDYYMKDWRSIEAGYHVFILGRHARRKVKPYPTLDEAKAAGYKLMQKEIRAMQKALDAVAVEQSQP